jgi:hypothetical protein
MDFTKIQNPCSAKGAIKRKKKSHRMVKNCFKQYISDKEIASKMSKELLKINSKKMSKLV